MKYFTKIKKLFEHTLIRNSLFGSSGFLFISFVGLVITPFLVSSFGVEQYGVYILITSLFGYYGMFDFGMGEGLIKFVSDYNTRDLTTELNDAVNSVVTFQFIIGVSLSISIVLLSKDIVQLFNVSELIFLDTTDAVKISAIGFFFNILASTYSSALKGLEFYGSYSLVNSLSNLLLNLALLIVLSFGFGIKMAISVNTIIAFFQFVLYLALFNKFKYTYRFKIAIKINILKKFFSFSFYIFLSKFSGLISTSVVRYLISYFLGPSAVTLFSVPSKLSGAIGGVLHHATNVIFPYTSRLVAKGSVEELKNSYLKANTFFSALCIPIFIWISFFSESILSFWMGEEFAISTWRILCVISLSGIFGSLTMIPTLVLLGMGQSKLISIFTGISSIINITLLSLFVTKYELLGVVFALLLTSVVTFAIMIIMTNAEIGISLSDYFRKVYSIHLIPILCFIIFYILLKLFLNISYPYVLLLGLLDLTLYYLILYKINDFNVFRSI